MPEKESRQKQTETRDAPAMDARNLLLTASREIIAETLSTKEGTKGLKAWRGLDKEGRGIRQARRLCDGLSALARLNKEHPAAGEQAVALIDAPSVGGGRVDELLALIAAERTGASLPMARPEVARIFQGLRKITTTEGEVSAVELLTSDKVLPGDKQKWFQAQLMQAIKFLEKRDLAEARKKAEEPPAPEVIEQKEQAPENNIPPAEQDKLAPSMEEMAKAKEGESGAYFTIAQFYGGYYREGHFARWNNSSLEWEREPRRWKTAVTMDMDIEEKTRRVYSGVVKAGEITPLPMPYGFVPDITSAKALGNVKVQILTEEGGGYAITAEGEGLVAFSMEIGRGGGSRQTDNAVSMLEMTTGKLSSNTEKTLQEIKDSRRQAIEQARILKQFVRRTLKYSNESAMNAVYRSGDPAKYFQRIEDAKKADCDVANTYFCALLARAGISARLVSGHYVQSKNKSGAAVISSGTGHVWAEVWDGVNWQRLDATPPGDPNMDEKETDEMNDEQLGEGDFGEQESKEISDEELEQMIQEAEARLKEKEISPEEKRALIFAEQAGCSPEEAKQITRQIEAARGLRDKQGRLIRSRLISEFQKIVQENLTERPRYKAPVRMSSGHDLADAVEARLGILAGEADPSGFAKHERQIKREQVYGGLDVIFVVDKSSSMSETGDDGLVKSDEQQKFVFLFADALYAAAQEFKRQRVKLISPVDVRLALVSFQGGGAKIELPLGKEWGPKEQYSIWKSLKENIGGGTPDHLGLNAAQQLLEEDAARTRGVAKGKNRLQLVLVSADGGSDDSAAVMAAKEHLKAVGVIVKAAGIGSGAKAVKAVYYPDGDNLENFAQAPDWAADTVLKEASKLYPRKIRK